MTMGPSDLPVPVARKAHCKRLSSDAPRIQRGIKHIVKMETKRVSRREREPGFTPVYKGAFR